MLLYNITYSIDENIHTQFIEWMKENHLKEVSAISFLQNCTILKLLTEIDNGGVTYTFQYRFTSMDSFDIFQNEYEDDLRNKVHQKFKGSFVDFASLLEEI
ncbi:protein of unknown function [Pseudarcicella hirudinis]|uniref:DUF4286 domain-containing protein n=1 Tax=Pseudarcicella hirudinis TaxID=1079859 RepID=A0A1I5SK68_9BACT|nr:DUF4286 family protein [Pseudarcicella hirudinis]SFP70907.1 protein of unknown function [Pseudarcicella hirudinis]